MRYNLKFRTLTLYGLTRPQSIRKSKQISGQTILSSPQGLEFNPNFAKNRDILACETSVSPRSSPLGTFREEERLRLSDRNSILMT